jgi:hypothetical protein
MFRYLFKRRDLVHTKEFVRFFMVCVPTIPEFPDYRDQLDFLQVIQKAKLACERTGHPYESAGATRTIFWE